MSPPNSDAYTAPSDQLELQARSIERDLFSTDMSYGERQQLALMLVRVLLERSLRETERRLGLRHPRG